MSFDRLRPGATSTDVNATVFHKTQTYTHALQELDAIIAAVEQTMPQATGAGAAEKKQKKQKQKKQQKSAPSKAAAAPADEESALFQKAELQVSRIVSAQKHPKADALVQLEVEIGRDRPNRQIVAGIYKYYTPEELDGKLVVTILNLKPIKLVGLESQGMLLAGSNDTYKAEDEARIVKLPIPPEGSEVGDRVYLKDRRDGSFVEEPGRVNDKQWKKIASGLAVHGGITTFNKIPLLTDKGELAVPDLKDGAEVH